MTVPQTKAGGPASFRCRQYLEVGPLRVGIGSVRFRAAAP